MHEVGVHLYKMEVDIVLLSTFASILLQLLILQALRCVSNRMGIDPEAAKYLA